MNRWFGRFRRPRRDRGRRVAAASPRDARAQTEVLRVPAPGAWHAAPPHGWLPLPPSIPPPIASPALPCASPAELAAGSRGARSLDADATRLVAGRGAVVAVLVGIAGRQQGEIYRVRDGENRVGRAQSAEICLGSRDDAVSREHALIVHRGGAFGLKALKRDNPTWLNGEPLDGGAPLADGDRVRVGESSFRFRTIEP